MSEDIDALLTEIIARHFPDARIVDGIIELGFADLEMVCQVHAVHDFGPYKCASLYFNAWGGELGPEPVFMSFTGYAEETRAAVITGACNWACSFGPVLRAGLGGEQQPGVGRFDVSLGGDPVHVFVDALDRAMFFAESDAGARDPVTLIPAARARFNASPWLMRSVLASGRLPRLARDCPAIVSVFVSDMFDQRVVEVKVDGTDCVLAQDVFAHVDRAPRGSMVLLRELAVVVPRTSSLSFG